MSLVSIRLPDDVDTKLASEAEHSGRPKSEIVREAIVDYLDRQERARFLGAIARASRARDDEEALAIADEALRFDNEAFTIADSAGVREPRKPYRAGSKAPKKR